MTDLESLLTQAVGVLEDAGVGFAVVGGLAVSVRSEPRFTRDIDIAVSVPDDPGAEGLVTLFLARGYRVTHLVEQEATGRLATVRLHAPGSPGEGPVLDLLFASSGIEAEIVSSADPLVVFPGCRVPVASRAHILAMKLLSRDDATRPQDRVDLMGLLRLATGGEIEAVRGAVDRIQQRGYHRGRDLPAELDSLREEAGLT